jgi:hypothetical protein
LLAAVVDSLLLSRRPADIAVIEGLLLWSLLAAVLESLLLSTRSQAVDDLLLLLSLKACWKVERPAAASSQRGASK